jgi:hypothetical protein
MTTIRTDFTIADVIVGKTVLRGDSTSGSRTSGIVRKIIPGIGFVVKGSSGQVSILWRSLALLESPAEPMTEVTVDGMTLSYPEPTNSSIPGLPPGLQNSIPGPPELCRTDSGADYGMSGYPDVAWWAAQGVLSAPYLATPYDYGSYSYPPPPLRLLELLEDCKEQAIADGGVFLEAWKRQRAQIEGMSLQIPSAHSLQDQRGKGILPGEFIKPDPVLTRQETRGYLLAELDRYMEGVILLDAGLIHSAGLQEAAVADEVVEGVWPAARLFMLYCGLRLTGKLGPSMTFRDIARWSISVIRGQLAGEPAVDPLEILALGFWTVDRFLPAGRTIGSFWDHSPFEALRSAPPLTEESEDEYADMPPLSAVDEEEDEYADMPPLMDLSGNLLTDFPAGGPMMDLSGNVLGPMMDLSGNVLDFHPMMDLSGNVLGPMMDLSGNVLDFPPVSPLPASEDDDDDPDDSDYDPEEDESESESESEAESDYDSEDAEEVDEEVEVDEEDELEDTETHYAPSYPAFAPEEVEFPSFLRQEVTLKCNVPVGALVAVFFTAFFYVAVAAIASQRR